MNVESLRFPGGVEMRATPVRIIVAAVVVALVASVAFAGSAVADRDVHGMPVTAHDESSSCVQETAPCFAIGGDATGLIEDDDELALTFTNNGTSSHRLVIAPGAEADPGNGTPTEAAFVELGPIEPGESVEQTVAVPRGTDTLHLFCDVGDHEQQGMHLSRNVYPGDSVQKAENQTIGDPGEDRIPSGPWIALAALGATGLLCRRRR